MSKTNYSATDFYGVKQLDDKNDIPIDTSWKYKNPVRVNSPSLGICEEMERRKNQDMISVRRRIAEITEDFSALDIPTHQPTKQEILQEVDVSSLTYNPYEDDEDDFYQENTWVVEEFTAELRNGKEVPVWKVLDESTGMQFPKVFRLKEPAHRIKNIMNESGNLNDPKLKSIVQLHDKFLECRKQVSRSKKMLSEGKISKKKVVEAQQLLLKIGNKLGIQ